MEGRELKLYTQRMQELAFLRSENPVLRGDRDHYRKEWFFALQRVNALEARVEKLEAENNRLRQQNLELTAAAKETLGKPGFVKPPAISRRRKKPGRKQGHAAALRPMPDHIDVDQDVPLPKDPRGRESCPCCSGLLVDLADERRLVEDIVPAKVVVTCYHTRSGFCPSCNKRVESRAPEQPPAASIPHGQLGLNALATGAVLRIEQRLPFRQVSAVFANLPGLSVCAGAIARQVQRIGDWFDGDYEKLKVALRCAEQVYADETGWRTNGSNGYLWAVTSPTHTLYHVNQSRGGKVIRKLLGKAFGGTLVSDFLSAYGTMDCKKQKCLVHLLRELNESAEKCPAFANGSFFKRSKRLIKQLLLLKETWNSLGDQKYFQRVALLEKRLDELAAADYSEANARRIGKRLRKHQKELTAFLHQKELDGTNNAAERAIRPAVVARKISGGSRSKAGADAWATVASLVRSARQQGRNTFEAVKSMLMAAWAEERPPTMPAGP